MRLDRQVWRTARLRAGCGPPYLFPRLTAYLAQIPWENQQGSIWQVCFEVRQTDRFVGKNLLYKLLGNPLPRTSLIVGVCDVKVPGDRNFQVDGVLDPRPHPVA
jgi:hypothetical protein